MTPPENVRLVDLNLYLPLSSKFVSVDHLYIKLPNGNITNFEANKTYIINAVNADGRSASYYADDDTLSLSGYGITKNTFHIKSLSTVLQGGTGVSLTETRIADNQWLTTINAEATSWNTEYINENPDGGLKKDTLYVWQNVNGTPITQLNNNPLILPDNPANNDRVGIFVLKLSSPNIVRIVPNDSTPIYVGVTNVMDDDEPGLDFEAPLCYAEIVYKANGTGNGWHVVKLITPSSQREYKDGDGLELVGNDTFRIKPGAAGQVLSTINDGGQLRVVWGNVSPGTTGGEPDGIFDCPDYLKFNLSNDPGSNIAGEGQTFLFPVKKASSINLQSDGATVFGVWAPLDGSSQAAVSFNTTTPLTATEEDGWVRISCFNTGYLNSNVTNSNGYGCVKCTISNAGQSINLPLYKYNTLRYTGDEKTITVDPLTKKISVDLPDDEGLALIKDGKIQLLEPPNGDGIFLLSGTRDGNYGWARATSCDD